MKIVFIPIAGILILILMFTFSPMGMIESDVVDAYMDVQATQSNFASEYASLSLLEASAEPQDTLSSGNKIVAYWPVNMSGVTPENSFNFTSGFLSEYRNIPNGTPHHEAVDITVNPRTNRGILSPIDGYISSIGTRLGAVYVTSTNGDVTFTLMHCKDISVNVGDTVKKGQTVGNMGGTGGYAVHLHYEVATKNPKYIYDTSKVVQLERLDTGGVGAEIIYLKNKGVYMFSGFNPNLILYEDTNFPTSMVVQDSSAPKISPTTVTGKTCIIN